MNDILLIVLSGLLLISVYIIHNLYIKVELLERKYADDLSEQAARTFNTYNFILNLCVTAAIRLRDIDRKGVFEKDDEVGIAFAAIRESIDQLKVQIESLQEVPDDEDMPDTGKRTVDRGGFKEVLYTQKQSAPGSPAPPQPHPPPNNR